MIDKLLVYIIFSKLYKNSHLARGDYFYVNHNIVNYVNYNIMNYTNYYCPRASARENPKASISTIAII